jgi:two-component system LytT family sensor kinase
MKFKAFNIDWKKWRIVAGIYLLTNIVFVIQRVIFDLQRGRPEDIITSLVDLVGFAGIWILFAVPVLWMTSRWQLSVRHLMALALAGIFLSFLHGALYLLFAMAIPGVMAPGTVTSIAEYMSTIAGLSHAWRFLSFGFLVVVSYAHDYYFLSKEREHRAVQLQVQLTEAKLNALKMQLHPHFLFNTLNAISVLVDDSPAVAKQTLAQLSDLLRLALENIETQEVPLRRELEFLDRYLLIQKTRYGSRLTVHKHIAADTMDASIPYLMLQPVVENALKHGIDTLPGPGTITISAARRNGELVLQVDDAGEGFRALLAATAGRGLGLTNTRARLQQLYGEQYALTMEDIMQGHGTRVTLVVPFKSSVIVDPNGESSHA